MSQVRGLFGEHCNRCYLGKIVDSFCTNGPFTASCDSMDFRSPYQSNAEQTYHIILCCMSFQCICARNVDSRSKIAIAYHCRHFPASGCNLNLSVLGSCTSLFFILYSLVSVLPDFPRQGSEAGLLIHL